MDQPTIDAYNFQAHRYDEQTSNFWKLFPERSLDQFAKLASGSSILDVGSGPGRDALLLSQRGLDVTCLDASSAMVEICLNRGLKATQADFNNLPFATDHFDGVWAYTSLLHLPKASIHRPLQEIYRVLKPKGAFGLGMIEGETEGYIASAKISSPRWFSYYKKAEIEGLLDQHNFIIKSFEVFKPGHKNYLNFICLKA